jgi:hypothetical protein
MGTWSRILSKPSVGKPGEGSSASTTPYVRVNASAANPAGGQLLQALGPGRGGLTTKIHALVDGKGWAMRLILSAGNVADITPERRTW